MHAHPPIGHADLHIHPSGDGVSAKTPTAVYAALRASGLQVAVLTDHNRIDVARELVTRSRDEGIPIVLLVGEEITTREGHLLGVGLTARVPAGLSLADAVAAVHDQGGIAVVAHPLLPTHMAASARLLVELAVYDRRQRPDALEAMHPMASRAPTLPGSRTAPCPPPPTSRAPRRTSIRWRRGCPAGDAESNGWRSDAGMR